MSFTRWLRNLQAVYHLRSTSRNGPRPRWKVRPRFRPRLEVLEDRLPPAVLTVNTTADDTTPNANDGSVSLREAIAAINNGSDGGDPDIIAQNPGTFGVNDTIQFALGPNPQTITLAGQELLISQSLSIVGPGAGLTVSGNHASRVFDIAGSTTVSLSGLTIGDGNEGGNVGGGIVNSGDLTVTNSTLAGNSATSGGGILNFGTLTVTNSTVAGNSASSAGGGIFNSGTLSVTNSTVAGNTVAKDGGGIFNRGDLTVTNSTVAGNSAARYGGGITNRFDGELTVTQSILAGNTAATGGGVTNFGTATVTNSTLSNNHANGASGMGGGIDNETGGTVTVANSILSHNFAGFSGGGILNLGTLKVTDSTLWGNTAAYVGGGISTRAMTTLTNCTVSGNSANGLDTAGGIDTSSDNPDASTALVNCTVAGNTNLNAAGPGGLFAGRYGSGQATVTLGNTIVADNSGNQFGTAGASVGPGTFVSQGYNLSSDASGNLSQPGDQQNTEPLLGPLQDNGGPLAGAPGSQQVVPTMALLPGSPAIDQGSDALAVDPVIGLPLFTDERGFDRVANDTVDIGAFEVQVYLVYSNADSGGGSLRSALSNADRAGGSVIAFTTGGTINLINPLPDIGRSVQILGPGADDLTVQRSTAAGTPNFRIFTVDGPSGAIHDVTVAIDGMTIANGNASLVNGNSRFGGGIFNRGDLTVSNCMLSGNTAQIDGGAIDNQPAGTLRVIDCTLVGNSAQATDGGIANLGTLTISGSILSGNTAPFGGGIGSNGPVKVTHCTFAGNSAYEGGGIFYRGSTLTVTDSIFTDNSAGYGGGIFSNAGMVTVTNSAFAGNSASVGGGIANEIASDSTSTLTAANCTFSGNSAVGGGGLHNSSKATLTNCTVSGNFANALDTAGGIDTSSFGPDASTTLVNCTVAGNTNYNTAGPGGLFAGRYGSGQATATLGNTIVADNSGNQFGTAGASVGPGTFVSLGLNLIGDSSGNGFTDPTDLSGLDPLLAPLGNYGGPTQTMALLPGSPAIDAADPALAPATDQRGVARNTQPDIGAFESRGFTLAVAGGNNQQALVNTPFAAPLGVTVSSVYGEPIQGGVVTFAVPPSGAGATFPGPNTATLDASGHASVSLDANGITGTYSVTASAKGANLTSFTLTNLPVLTISPASLPDATAGVAYSQTFTASGGAGGPYTFAVTAGALRAGFSLSSSGVLSGSTTLAGTSSFTVTATDHGGFTASQAYTLTIDPAAATHFFVSTPSGTTAGNSFSFTVTAQDPFNNTATGYTGTIHFTSSDANATLPANATLSNGVGTFSGTLKTAGFQTITATDTNAGSSTGSSTIAVSPAAATHFFVSAPSSTTAGNTFTFTVTALDPFNNTATGYGGTVHFTSSDPQAVLPANAPLTNGTGTFSATLKTAGIQSLTATDANASSINGSGGITVNPGAATHFGIAGPSSVTAGSAFNLTVTALDAYGNVATGYTGTVKFASSDNSAKLPGKYTYAASDQGVHPFTGLVLHKKGWQTITVYDTSNNTILGTISIDVL